MNGIRILFVGLIFLLLKPASSSTSFCDGNTTNDKGHFGSYDSCYELPKDIDCKWEIDVTPPLYAIKLTLDYNGEKYGRCGRERLTIASVSNEKVEVIMDTCGQPLTLEHSFRTSHVIITYKTFASHAGGFILQYEKLTYDDFEGLPLLNKGSQYNLQINNTKFDEYKIPKAVDKELPRANPKPMLYYVARNIDQDPDKYPVKEFPECGARIMQPSSSIKFDPKCLKNEKPKFCLWVVRGSDNGNIFIDNLDTKPANLVIYDGPVNPMNIIWPSGDIDRKVASTASFLTVFLPLKDEAKDAFTLKFYEMPNKCADQVMIKEASKPEVCKDHPKPLESITDVLLTKTCANVSNTDLLKQISALVVPDIVLDNDPMKSLVRLQIYGGNSGVNNFLYDSHNQSASKPLVTLTNSMSYKYDENNPLTVPLRLILNPITCISSSETGDTDSATLKSGNHVLYVAIVYVIIWTERF